ncbi:MAG: exodeoxyribonuclease VII small subunit [Tissierellia bacterium]|nr:exodeoxyribonuclease VII small subunit [Tissierellia bacterium]
MKEISKMTFEEAVEELEKIIEELENENLPIKDSLEKFKRGMALYEYCNDILNKVEGEIKILLKDDQGTLAEEDFFMEV